MLEEELQKILIKHAKTAESKENEWLKEENNCIEDTQYLVDELKEDFNTDSILQKEKMQDYQKS